MLWCLHGFLGRGADWEALRAGWEPDLPALRTPNLFTDPPRHESLAEFGVRFANEVAQVDAAPAILGYSLGGRLALHALIARPERWKAAIVVSAHLGMLDAAERATRVADDAGWADRFRTGVWAAVIEDWNARPAFGGRPSAPPRPQSAYDREALAAALADWSLGRQDPLDDHLSSLTMPILWVAGERDTRFVAEGERARTACPTVELTVAPGIVHRVPWEAPEWFALEVAGFLRRHHVVSS